MTSHIRGGGAYYPPPSQPIYHPGPNFYPQNQPNYYPPNPPPPNQGYRTTNYSMSQSYNMQTRVPLQDPDEAFKVNSSPPPYSEIVKEQKP